MRQSKIQNMTRCAFGAALMSICAWITIPGPVPITLQTFGLYVILLLFGGKQGTVAIGTYLLLGMVGLPVFSGFQGGFGVLLGATGGYLSGFLVSALLYWLLTKWGCPSLPALILGLLGCYGFGSLWYLLAYAGNHSVWAVVSTCVLPFLIPDGIKLALAYSLSARLKKHIA